MRYKRLKMKRYCCFNFFSSSHHLSLTNYWTSYSVFVCIFFFFLSFVSFFRTAFHQRYDGALLLAVFLIASTNNLCKPFLPLGMMMMILIIFRKYTSIFYDSVSSSSVSKLAPCSWQTRENIEIDRWSISRRQDESGKKIPCALGNTCTEASWWRIVVTKKDWSLKFIIIISYLRSHDQYSQESHSL